MSTCLAYLYNKLSHPCRFVEPPAEAEKQNNFKSEKWSIGRKGPVKPKPPNKQSFKL